MHSNGLGMSRYPFKVINNRTCTLCHSESSIVLGRLHIVGCTPLIWLLSDTETSDLYIPRTKEKKYFQLFQATSKTVLSLKHFGN